MGTKRILEIFLTNERDLPRHASSNAQLSFEAPHARSGLYLRRMWWSFCKEYCGKVRVYVHLAARGSCVWMYTCICVMYVLDSKIASSARKRLRRSTSRMFATSSCNIDVICSCIPHGHFLTLHSTHTKRIGSQVNGLTFGNKSWLTPMMEVATIG